MISGNINQTVEIDSIKCDFNQYPYRVNTYARQMIIRESSLTVRSLITSCRLLNATRSDNNPHGFIMEAFTIMETRICKHLNGKSMKVKRIASKRCRIGRTTNCAKCAGVSRREKADSYTPYVCVLRRYVHLYNRVLYLQYRKTGRAAVTNRTYQAVALTADKRQYQPFKLSERWKKYRRMKREQPYRKRTADL